MLKITPNVRIFAPNVLYLHHSFKHTYKKVAYAVL